MFINVNGKVFTDCSPEQVKDSVVQFLQCNTCMYNNLLQFTYAKSVEANIVIISGSIECSELAYSAEEAKKDIESVIHRDFGINFNLEATETNQPVEA